MQHEEEKDHKAQNPTSTTQVPNWVLDDPPVPNRPVTKQDLDELAAGVEAGSRDTPAWKELVRRVGKKEASRILKVSVFSRHAVRPEPNN